MPVIDLSRNEVKITFLSTACDISSPAHFRMPAERGLPFRNRTIDPISTLVLPPLCWDPASDWRLIMRMPKLLAGLALAVAIAGTSALSAVSVSSAFAAVGDGGPSSGNEVPQYYQPFLNPLIPQYPQQPVFGP